MRKQLTRRMRIIIITILLAMGAFTMSCGLEGGCRDGVDINGNPCS